MSLTPQEVDHIAKLARLNLSLEERARYGQQLSSILDYVAMLQELDTSSIPPTEGMRTAGSNLRADEPCASLPTEKLLENAPQARDLQFKVPPVFE